MFLKLIVVLYTVLLVYSLRISQPYFRPWEQLYDESGHRFFPNRSLTMTAIGDLGREVWIRELQVAKEVTFTTDEWGFRNRKPIHRPPIVVFGDSFLAGCGLTDGATLTARMSELLGVDVYNFGVQKRDFQLFLLTDPRFEKFSPDVVIWTPVSRNIGPRPLLIRPNEAPPPSPAQRAIAIYRKAGVVIAGSAERINRDNQLSVQARFLYNELLYQIAGHKNVIYPEGRGTPPVLALDVEAQGLLDLPAERHLDGTIATVSFLSGYLNDRGIQFIYSPIPESATIYPELFEDRERIVSPSLLDILLPRLREAGVVTVDLRPVFEAHKRPYLYLPDDSHWNPRAIDLAARALSETLTELRMTPLTK